MRGGYKTVYGADAPWESFRDDDGDDGFGGGRVGGREGGWVRLEREREREREGREERERKRWNLPMDQW